jgi:hypothetical protein
MTKDQYPMTMKTNAPFSVFRFRSLLPALCSLLLALCSLLYVGCKPEAPPESASDRFERQLKTRKEKVSRLGTNAVDFEDVYYAIRRAGVKDVRYVRADDVYVTPDRKWVTGELTSTLRSEFFDLGLLSTVGSAYGDEKFDCDDFADGAAFLAQATARTQLRTKAGVVFGVLYYDRDGPLGRHAVNFSLTRDAGLIFYEPQRLMEITLSASELASVDFWRF